jgi:hypothetical protein
MTYIPEEPPDQNEQFESLDEALDEQDLPGHGGGPEGDRDIDDLVLDQAALEEAGAALDDPDRISMLDGGMDDPDGSGPPEEQSSKAAPRDRTGVEPGTAPELDLIDTDAIGTASNARRPSGAGLGPPVIVITYSGETGVQLGLPALRKPSWAHLIRHNLSRLPASQTFWASRLERVDEFGVPDRT